MHNCKVGIYKVGAALFGLTANRESQCGVGKIYVLKNLGDYNGIGL